MDRNLTYAQGWHEKWMSSSMRLILLFAAVVWMACASARPAAAESDISALPDPTRPITAGESDEVRVRGLTSIRITSRGRQAVIDGRTVTIGDTVAGGVIRDIRPDEVILKDGDRVSTLRLMPELKRNAPQRNTAK